MIFLNITNWLVFWMDGKKQIIPIEEFINLSKWSAIYALLIIFLVLVIIYFYFRYHKARHTITNKSLLKPFVLIWIANFVVYNVGMYTGQPESLLANTPMAIIHAFGVFILESDVSAIHDEFHNSWQFMLAFSLSHFFAAFISLIFVIKHFGYNILAGLRFFYASLWFAASKKNTYIFWGMNDATYTLADSIKDHHEKEKDKDFRIVVVRTNNDTDATSTKSGMERLFNFLSLRNSDLERLQDLDCLTTSTFTNIAQLPNAKKESIRYLELMGLKRIEKLIRNTTEKVHVFFLSENEEENIQAVTALKKDLTICNFLARGDNHSVKFYCHARYNSVHRVIEDEQTTDNCEIKVIDSSHISVELLKQKVELQPVSFVDIEKDATVSSPFHSLVVGFSEIGRDAVSFLYEFGSFVKSGGTNNHVERSEFHCHVVDKNIANLAGLFVANTPSIKPAMPFMGDSETQKSSIILHHIDCQSVAFYQELEGLVKDNLNYVVICTENDDLNISLAVRIFKLAIRYRKTMDNFCILVRIHNDDTGHVRQIAEHYNRLWAAELQSIDKKKRTHQKTVLVNEQIQMPIYVFGLDKDTYTYDNIISDKLEDDAKHFKAKYDASINALKKLSGYDEEDVPSWENEHKDLMQLTDEYQGYSPTYSGIMRLRRIQSQNIANSLHIHTKQRLAYRALGEKDYSTLAKHQLIRKINETVYSWKEYVTKNDSIIRVLDVLAQTEHLRWNASHEILGYRDKGSEEHKDEAKLQHGCLKNWQDLSSIFQSYDYNVVDVSLDIIDLNRQE